MSMLEKYRKKRDFTKTSEPSGKQKKCDNEELIFMIHKHHASHLHYDLRLELDGVLKSWAVPKGPSLDPEIKRLAMMVEDHPFEYKDFEGVIPEGEYGAGPSLIWDAGAYAPKDARKSKEENEEIIRKKLEKGHLRFVLYGEKLKGEFSLIHIPDKKKNNTWLLTKVRDAYANDVILHPDVSVKSGLTIEELRKGKIKKEIPDGTEGPLPKDINPMLATLIDAPFTKKDWIFEIKWDGYRAIAQVQKWKPLLYSRNGISFHSKFPEILEELKRYPDIVLDGEVVVFNEEMRQDFGMLQNFEKTGEGYLVYYVFDILYYDGKILSDLPLLRRKEILKQALQESAHIKFTDHVAELWEEFFEAAKAQELEGVIGKRAESKYQFGKRGADWVKIKNILTQEAVICGYTAPRGSRKGFGALILGVYQDEKLVYIGHAGGGFDDAALAKMKKRLDVLKTKSSPFQIVPIVNEAATWVKPEIVCEVKFQEWTKDGLMRQPIFLGIREDKKAKEVGREKPEKKSKTLRKAAKSNKKTEEVSEVPKLPLSHLDKIYFPEDMITKGDVIEYYRKIAPHILPFLQNRPQTLVRFPNGIHKNSFYQKNVNQEDVPPWICTEHVYSESEDRTVNYAVICKDLESLLYLVNLGCIELHPWSSRVESLDYPDYVIFDFDPEDIPFNEVVKAVQATWEVLDSIGVPVYCKTSGATGIHLFVPTGTKYTYEQVMVFAKLINTVVHSKLPATTSLERMPKKRQKKVYLDFLQNRRGQTIASVYSLRARLGAPVSTPITREELKEGLDPKKFTINTIFTRLKKLWNLWADMFKEELDMENCLKKLGKYID